MKKIPNKEELKLILYFSNIFAMASAQGDVDLTHMAQGMVTGCMVGCGVSDLQTVMEDTRELSRKLLSGEIEGPGMLEDSSYEDIKRMVDDMFREE